MIRVYYYQRIVVTQAQLPDFISSSKITVYEIHRYKRIDFDRTIEVWARKKRRSKRLMRFRKRRSVQITLLRFVKKLEEKRGAPPSAQIPHMNGELNVSCNDAVDGCNRRTVFIYISIYAC